jgi:hypothetical protein
MITTRRELEATILLTKQELRDRSSCDVDITIKNLHDIGTLNMLLDAATQELEIMTEDKNLLLDTATQKLKEVLKDID